eukprot:RCo042582
MGLDAPEEHDDQHRHEHEHHDPPHGCGWRHGRVLVHGFVGLSFFFFSCVIVSFWAFVKATGYSEFQIAFCFGLAVFCLHVDFSLSSGNTSASRQIQLLFSPDSLFF